MAADHAQLTAIERPAKIADLFGFEIGDLFSGRTVERLEPEVFSVLVTKRINDSLAVMGEAGSPQACGGALQIQDFRVLRKIEWNQCQLLFCDARRRKGCKSRQLAVGRNVEPERGKIGESFRRSSVQRHPSKLAAVGCVRVIYPLSVGRADWIPIPVAIAELLEVPAPRVHAPDCLRLRVTATDNRGHHIAGIWARRRPECSAILF